MAGLSHHRVTDVQVQILDVSTHAGRAYVHNAARARLSADVAGVSPTQVVDFTVPLTDDERAILWELVGRVERRVNPSAPVDAGGSA